MAEIDSPTGASTCSVQSALKGKQPLRDELAADMEAFLARGGTIQRLAISSERPSWHEYQPQPVSPRRPGAETIIPSEVPTMEKPQETAKQLRGSPQLREQIVQEFRDKGETLNAWCRANNLSSGSVSITLKDGRGVRAHELITRIRAYLDALPTKAEKIASMLEPETPEPAAAPEPSATPPAVLSDTRAYLQVPLVGGDPEIALMAALEDVVQRFKSDSIAPVPLGNEALCRCINWLRARHGPGSPHHPV